MFTNPQEDGRKQAFTITGEPYWFTTDTVNAFAVDEQDLPLGLVYSFHHGLNEIERWGDGVTDWSNGITQKDLLEFDYREVSPEDVAIAKKGKTVEFLSLDDVRKNKHLFRENAFTDKQVRQLHELTNTPFPAKRSVSPDMWPYQCQLQARAIFNKITNNVSGKMHNRR